MSLANVYVLARQPDRALELVPQLRSTATGNPGAALETARIQALAQNEKGDFPGAVKTLQEAIRAHPDQDAGYGALVELHLSRADKLNIETNFAGARMELTNALRVVDGQLKTQSNNVSGHFLRGRVCVYLEDFDGAVDAFTKVLEAQKDNSAALLNRALARLQGGKLDAAKTDYEEFLRRFTPNFRVYYGLGEIAYRQNDWSTARQHYKEYLRYAPAGSGEANTVRERLQQLKKK
jgi:tetratricopeptide (TPR) repeat protein